MPKKLPVDLRPQDIPKLIESLESGEPIAAIGRRGPGKWVVLVFIEDGEFYGGALNEDGYMPETSREAKIAKEWCDRNLPLLRSAYSERHPTARA